MTNGILLDKTVINKLKKYKFIKIYVSFDGIKKETYEKLR
jgi:MoaA/NifB/PqqE/SkfB family radical SAM enzyme